MGIKHWRIAGLVAVLGAPLFVIGCTFVALEPEGERVEVAESAEQVEECQRVGRTRVTTAERVAFILRRDTAIEDDLDRLARNSGADLGGDTVVRESEIEEGRATYGVYDCGR